MTFELTSVLDVVAGPGVASAVIRSMPIATTIAVVDPALAGAPHWAGLSEADRLIEVAPGEPTSDTVQMIVDTVATLEVDTVVAVGGGSALDTGKIVAALSGNPGSPVVEHLMGGRRCRRTVGLVAIPTTAGTGAEATRTCVLSHEGRKTWLFDDALAPDRVVLDPRMTVGMPPPVTVATGLDAFVHAVEAFTNRHRNDVADDAALAAIEAITEGLPGVVTQPSDLFARARMLEAATAAGIAIDRCGTAMGHCVGHALASFSRMPHGVAVALGMRASLEWSVDGDPDRFGAVAAAMGGPADARRLPVLVDALLARVGFEDLLDRWPADGIEAELLAAEMDIPANRPMAAAGARTPGVHDLADIAASVVRRWRDR